jgi:hypothetical protein
MRGFLYPLIGFLALASNLHSTLSSYPELSIILPGLLASFLIGGFYVGLPLAIVSRLLRIRRFNSRPCAFTLLIGFDGVLLGLIISSVVVLMIADSITILAAISTSALLTANGISQLTSKMAKQSNMLSS